MTLFFDTSTQAKEGTVYISDDFRPIFSVLAEEVAAMRCIYGSACLSFDQSFILMLDSGQ